MEEGFTWPAKSGGGFSNDIIRGWRGRRRTLSVYIGFFAEE